MRVGTNHEIPSSLRSSAADHCPRTPIPLLFSRRTTREEFDPALITARRCRMQLRTTFLAVWSLVAALAAGVAPRLAAQTGKVLCESRGGGRAQCAIERGARGGLTQHLNDTPR